MLKKLTNLLKKPIVAIIVTVLLVAGATISGISFFKSNSHSTDAAQETILKEVGSLKLDLNNDDTTSIETVGTVKAKTSVDITAQVSGNVRGLYFKVGDKVETNRILASLYDSALLTSLNNANTNLTNTKGNFLAIERLAEESLRQAELGVQSAEEAIDAARIGLDSAKNRLENAKSLKIKTDEDTKKNAIVGFSNYLNTIFTTLEDVNYIIQADNNGIQLPGIKEVLGVKDISSLSLVKADYWQLKSAYDNLSFLSPTASSIEADMIKMNLALENAKTLVDSTLNVLENTVTSTNFNDLSLTGQVSAFSARRAGILSSQSGAKNSLQALQNLKLFYDQDIDQLESGVEIAENQLKRTETGLENALVAMNNAAKARDQQLLNANAAIDNASGQVNLTRTQTSDLTIKAPISGTITGKYVEPGADLNPGQKIAQISQIDEVIVELSLPSEDIYRIKPGQIAYVGNDHNGTVVTIDPAADPITRKVRLEIAVDNHDHKLIQGTFIDVSLPIEQPERTISDSIFIPLKAVIITQTETYVFIIENNLAVKRDVVIGKTEGSLVEIINGLGQDDELIIDGSKNIQNGDPVKTSI